METEAFYVCLFGHQLTALLVFVHRLNNMKLYLCVESRPKPFLPMTAYTVFIYLQIDGLSGNAYTYDQLTTLIDNFASSLWRMGFRQFDRLCLFTPNCVEFVIAYFGVLSLGGVVCALNPLFTSCKLLYLFCLCFYLCLIIVININWIYCGINILYILGLISYISLI